MARTKDDEQVYESKATVGFDGVERNGVALLKTD